LEHAVPESPDESLGFRFFGPLQFLLAALLSGYLEMTVLGEACNTGRTDGLN
jgi:hypothetical protein